MFLQIHNKLQDVGSFSLSNTFIDFNDSLNSTFNHHNNLNNIFEENLNVIHNNLANNNYLSDAHDLYIIENTINNKKIGSITRQQTFSPGDVRLKHFF